MADQSSSPTQEKNSLHAFSFNVDKIENDYKIELIHVPQLDESFDFIEKSKILSADQIAEQFNIQKHAHYVVGPNWTEGPQPFFQVRREFKSPVYVVLIDLKKINDGIDISKLTYSKNEDEGIIYTLLLLSFLNHEVLPTLYDNKFLFQYLQSLNNNFKFKINSRKVICHSGDFNTQLYLYLLDEIFYYSKTHENLTENQSLPDKTPIFGSFKYFYTILYFIFEMIELKQPIDEKTASSTLFPNIATYLAIYADIKVPVDFRQDILQLYEVNQDDSLFALIFTFVFYLRNNPNQEYKDFNKYLDNVNVDGKKFHHKTNLQAIFDALVFGFVPKILFLFKAEEVKTTFMVNFVAILKKLLPNRYWAYFVENYLFSSCIFESSIVEIVGNNCLFGELLKSNPQNFESIFNSTISKFDQLYERNNPTSISIGIIRQQYLWYKNNLPYQSIRELLNDPVSKYRNLYFSLPYVTLKLSPMNFHDFLSLNNDDYQQLIEFYDHNYYDYKQNSEQNFGDKLKTIIQGLFDSIIVNADRNQMFAYGKSDIVDSQLTRISKSYLKNNEAGSFGKLLSEIYPERDMNAFFENGKKITEYIINNAEENKICYSTLNDICPPINNQ